MIARNDIHNRFLRALPPNVLARLEPSLHRSALLSRQYIAHADTQVQFVYFVEQGFISLVKTMRDGRSVEVGGIGVEGLTNPSAVLGTLGFAALDAMVQIPGSAFRIDRQILKRVTEQEPALRHMIEDCARFQLHQAAQIAACNRLHSVEERCCRWLLTAQDNAAIGMFSLTHEFLAMMLGSQRVGVSIVAKSLQRAGLIDYSRGVVSIKDRAGLAERACECYAAAQAELRILYSTETGDYANPGEEGT